MTAFSDFLEQGIREHFKRDTQLPLEDTYVALYTTATSDAGGGTEVSGGNYARQQVYQATTPSTPYWTNHSTATGIQNLQAITFPQATSSWGTIGWFAVVDHATSATPNFLFHGALTSSKTISTNDTFEFAAGDLKIAFD